MILEPAGGDSTSRSTLCFHAWLDLTLNHRRALSVALLDDDIHQSTGLNQDWVAGERDGSFSDLAWAKLRAAV